MDVKPLMENGIFNSLKASPHTLLINYRDKNIDFSVEKPGKTYINQVIKVTITNKGQSHLRYSLTRFLPEETICQTFINTKMHILNLIMKKHVTNSK